MKDQLALLLIFTVCTRNLREGNVISHVCLSVCSQQGGCLHMTSTHDAIGQSKVIFMFYSRHLTDDHHETLVKIM